MTKIDREARRLYGDPPENDPVARAAHVVRVFMSDDAQPRVTPDEVLVTCTSNAYDGVMWTGMTWGDLQALWQLAEQARSALEMLLQMEAALDALRAPIHHDSGARLTPVGRLSKFLAHSYQPRREDAVARWLKRMRDQFGTQDQLSEVTSKARELKWRWSAIDALLDRYRECADYGISLEPEDDDKGD